MWYKEIGLLGRLEWFGLAKEIPVKEIHGQQKDDKFHCAY
jgi:hypothetical protein